MPAEQLERPALRRRGEGEEREVRLAAARGHGGRERVLRIERRRRRLGLLGERQLRLDRSRAEGGLQILRGLAGLARMRLVHDDREAPMTEVLDLVEDERELLQRRDDDPDLLARSSASASWALSCSERRDHAGRVLELEDRLLELAIEDDPVGDHHDLVEDRLIVERRGATSADGPARRSCSTCPSRPNAGRGSSGPNLPRAPPPPAGGRRPTGGIAGRSSSRCILRGMGRPLAGYDVDEPAQNVEPGVASPDLLPEVAGPVAVGIGRVALAAGVAAVERQEARLLAREPRRHLDQLGIDREVHERPAAEGDVGRVAIGPVLALGVLDGLVRQWVLQLGRRDRDAVDEEAEVERLRRRRSYGSWRVTVRRLARYRWVSSGVRPWAGLKKARRTSMPWSLTP